VALTGITIIALIVVIIGMDIVLIGGMVVLGIGDGGIPPIGQDGTIVRGIILLYWPLDQ